MVQNSNWLKCCGGTLRERSVNRSSQSALNICLLLPFLWALICHPLKQSHSLIENCSVTSEEFQAILAFLLHVSHYKQPTWMHEPKGQSSSPNVPTEYACWGTKNACFLQVNHISLYGGFIENYEKAAEIVRKCTLSDPRFRTIAEVLKVLDLQSWLQ